MQKRNKQVGMNDKDIRNLQASLRTLGYPIEDADGTFGASTRQAVKDFQKDHQLPVTGTVDVATTDAIKIALEQHPGPIDPTPGPGGDIPTPRPPEEDTAVQGARRSRPTGWLSPSKLPGARLRPGAGQLAAIGRGSHKRPGTLSNHLRPHRCCTPGARPVPISRWRSTIGRPVIPSWLRRR